VATLLNARHAVLFALDREAAPFLKSRKPIHRFADAPCAATLYETARGSVLVLISGVGFDLAKTAIDWLLAEMSPRLVVAAGFAGALDPDLKQGEIVVATEVVEADDQHWRTSLPAELGDETCGRMLTSRRLIASRYDKLKMFESTHAIAVDMESAAIAEACQVAHVPCEVVRVISDVADQPISEHLARLLVGGRVSPFRVFAATITKPSLVPQFWRLGRETKIASQNLAVALNRIIPS
jgi:adenosylhomocysteine nucleosidase